MPSSGGVVRAVIQRVSEASVAVEGRQVSAIGAGMLVLLAVQRADTAAEAAWFAARLPALRIFADEAGRMNRSLLDTGGQLLIVSQFTLAASLERGRRPSFEDAAQPELARQLYDQVVAELARTPLVVRTGLFGAMMQVSLVNDGPVTFTLEHRHA